MDCPRLVRGFQTLEAAASAVNALCDAGIDHGAIGMRAAAAGVYLVIVQPADAGERALAEAVLAGVGSPADASGPHPPSPHLRR